jgi:hypothetical protein
MKILFLDNDGVICLFPTIGVVGQRNGLSTVRENPDSVH